LRTRVPRMDFFGDATPLFFFLGVDLAGDGNSRVYFYEGLGV